MNLLEKYCNQAYSLVNLPGYNVHLMSEVMIKKATSIPLNKSFVKLLLDNFTKSFICFFPIKSRNSSIQSQFFSKIAQTPFTNSIAFFSHNIENLLIASTPFKKKCRNSSS